MARLAVSPGKGISQADLQGMPYALLFVSVNKVEGLTPVFLLGSAYAAGTLPKSHQVRAFDN